MRKILLMAIVAAILASATPSHAFLDYLFGGAGSRDAIGNSVVGDLRAWWSGNPVYTFDPYYSGPATQSTGAPGTPPGSYGQAPYPGSTQGYGSAPQYSQPTMTFTPPTGAVGAYGQPYQQPVQQMASPYPQGYSAPMQQAPTAYGGGYQQPMQPSPYPYGQIPVQPGQQPGNPYAQGYQQMPQQAGAPGITVQPQMAPQGYQTYGNPAPGGYQ